MNYTFVFKIDLQTIYIRKKKKVKPNIHAIVGFWPCLTEMSDIRS